MTTETEKREWPADGHPASFSELMEPVKAALLFAYNISRRNEGESIPYDGFNTGGRERITCFGPTESLSAESLAFGLEDQDETALDTILRICFQLGMEQGRRTLKSSTAFELIAMRAEMLGGQAQAVMDSVKKLLSF